MWHIAVPCSNDPEKFRKVLGAAIEYTPVSPELAQQLQRADSPLELANIYASHGIWYDAIHWANIARSELQSSQYWQQLLAGIKISQ